MTHTHAKPQTSDRERDKYRRIWAKPQYSEVSPGEMMVPLFAKVSRCQPGESVIDLGAGTGRASLKLRELHGLDVTMLDITWDGLEEQLKGEGFMSPEEPPLPNGDMKHITSSLWADWPRGRTWDYGFCADVMEHMPLEYSMCVVARALSACRRVFFHISFRPDACGKLIGEPLHLTVMSFVWWRDHLSELGEVLEARDLLGQGMFYVKGR